MLTHCFRTEWRPFIRSQTVPPAPPLLSPSLSLIDNLFCPNESATKAEEPLPVALCGNQLKHTSNQGHHMNRTQTSMYGIVLGYRFRFMPLTLHTDQDRSVDNTIHFEQWICVVIHN